MKKYLAAVFLLFYTITSYAQRFTLHSSATMEEITMEKMVSQLAAADVVFIGEQHDDSLTHVAEFQVLQALYTVKEKDLALSLEMFETDCQPVLNEYLGGFINEDRLLKDGRAWTNYKDYRPLVEFAKQHNMPVIAANAPRRYVNLVSRRGMKSLDSLSKEAKKWLPPLPYDTLQGTYHEKFNKLMDGHGSSNIYYSQSLWDASMSYSIYRYQKKNKKKLVYHLCGSFHSDEKLGTVAQLQKRKSSLVIRTISCIPYNKSKEMSKDELAGFADFVIITNIP